jgi:hypothetical protein
MCVRSGVSLGGVKGDPFELAVGLTERCVERVVKGVRPVTHR